MRLTSAAQRKAPTRTLATPASIPASIKGWDKISALSDMPPDHAVQLDNFIPRPGYLEVRRGYELLADGVGDSTTPVETVMPYNGTSTNKLFAIGGGTIYDVTAGGTAVATSITGWSNSRAQYVNFTNASQVSYLVAVNGANTPAIYNGSAWANMSLTGITASDAIHVAAWKGRLWFALKNSTQVGYMGVGAISGAVTKFDLGSFMTRGGYIMAIDTWTIDTRQTVNEYLAFITSRGQVIVYDGTDPTTADTFVLVGLYDIGPPIGRRCTLRIAGDLNVISIDGVIGMSEMLSTDRAAANRVSITSIIMNAIAQAARLYSTNFGWQFIEYAKSQLAILNIPQVENSTSVQFVMNTLTGAWCQFVGINANCWAVDVHDNVFFGGNDGTVYQWDVGSGDGDNSITATVQTAFNYFDTRGRLKRWTMIRPVITTDGQVTPGVGLNVDYGTGAPISTPSATVTQTVLWDVAVWDESIWPVNSATSANWTTVEGIGQCCSIVTSVITTPNGTQNGVTLQLNSWDLTMEIGGFI